MCNEIVEMQRERDSNQRHAVGGMPDNLPFSPATDAIVYFSASIFEAFSCGPLTKLLMDRRDARFVAAPFTFTTEIREARLFMACNQKCHAE